MDRLSLSSSELLTSCVRIPPDAIVRSVVIAYLFVPSQESVPELEKDEGQVMELLPWPMTIREVMLLITLSLCSVVPVRFSTASPPGANTP